MLSDQIQNRDFYFDWHHAMASLLSLWLRVRKALPNHTMDIICETLGKGTFYTDGCY
jgi:hypothetical protein